MTDLKKRVVRVSAARRHEKSRARHVILSLEPPAEVGVRLQGTMQTYRLSAEEVYELAVRGHERRIERRAKQIAREDGCTLRRARSQARKELKKELRAK